jgi:tetratricopeptide (TPR) repeat protein
VDGYLYLLCLRTYGIEDPRDPGEAVSERYKTSPLFIYLNATKKDVRQVKEYERMFPDFAELFALAGEDLLQAARYNAARAYFKKAMELLPDYTRAINGLGNLYFFALEDHERALEYYESALKQDPENTAALFGKGAVLHHTDKYSESNAALDRMLESDISRRGRASNASIRYYKAEANYYKAYNHYLMGQLSRARQFVDASKSHMPDSENTNYLSGLLYFGEKNLEAARKDFLTAVQRGGTNCNAHYYLGLIDHESGEREGFEWFLRACSCIEGSVRGIEKQIQSVSGLDLEEIEKATLRVKLEKKLLSFRHSSAAQIETMIEIVTGAETVKGKYYLDILSGLLSRLRVPLNKN